MNGQSDFYEPFSTWQTAYACALKMIWYQHASDLLIPRMKAMIKCLADEYGLSYKLCNELMQWPAGQEDEDEEPTPGLTWLRG